MEDFTTEPAAPVRLLSARGGPLVHLTAHAGRGRLAFRTWAEARGLWDRLAQPPTGLAALCLMPDHVHILSRAPDPRTIVTALRGYALWLNARRGERGRLWERLSDRARIPDEHHARRTERYVHLNPCRWPHLVSDPLAWPFSTYRDALGRVLDWAREPVAAPAAYHSYITSDPDVRPFGTPLPAKGAAAPTLDEVAVASTAVSRVPLSELCARAAVRRLFIHAARSTRRFADREIAERAGVDPRTVRRFGRSDDAATRLVLSVVGDSRFPALGHEDLRTLPAWKPFEHRR